MYLVKYRVTTDLFETFVLFVFNFFFYFLTFKKIISSAGQTKKVSLKIASVLLVSYDYLVLRASVQYLLKQILVEASICTTSAIIIF